MTGKSTLSCREVFFRVFGFIPPFVVALRPTIDIIFPSRLVLWPTDNLANLTRLSSSHNELRITVRLQDT